jgi:hypothetical protein
MPGDPSAPDARRSAREPASRLNPMADSKSNKANSVDKQKWKGNDAGRSSMTAEKRNKTK